MDQLVLLCEQLLRDEVGGVDVRAVLAFSPKEGFYLWAQDGPVFYSVVDGNGLQISYRTIETALDDLGEIPGLSPEIAVFRMNTTLN